MLEFLQAKAADRDSVFLSERGNEPLIGNRRWLEDAVKKAGMGHFTWHDLRRIQELMGHKTISMTCRYAHFSPADLLAAVETLVSNRVPPEMPPQL